MENKIDSVIVSYDSEKKIMIIGRKQVKQSVQIINALQDEEAEELYRRLCGDGGYVANVPGKPVDAEK